MFVSLRKLYFKKITIKNSFRKNNNISMINLIKKFENYISGEWSNREQSEKFPSLWAHVCVCYRPLPYKLLNMTSFYVESSFGYMIDKPYKTAVLGLIDKNDHIEAKIFKIKEPQNYWFGAYDFSLLKNLNESNLIKTPSECDIIFKYKNNDDIFIGFTKPNKKCIIDVNNIKTYLDSRITFNTDIYTSWDIGRDLKNDIQVWGSTNGPFYFHKIRSF